MSIISSKFSKSVYGDANAVYMSTPEIVSNRLGSYLLEKYKIDGNKLAVIELCSAIGLSCIILSEYVDKVVGIESDEKRVEHARSNARVYDRDDVSFICDTAMSFATLADIVEQLQDYKRIYLIDPDWSLNESSDHLDSIDEMQPNPQYVSTNIKGADNGATIILRLPPTIDDETLYKLNTEEVVHVIVNDKTRFLYAILSKQKVANIESVKRVKWTFDTFNA